MPGIFYAIRQGEISGIETTSMNGDACIEHDKYNKKNKNERGVGKIKKPETGCGRRLEMDEKKKSGKVVGCRTFIKDGLVSTILTQY